MKRLMVALASVATAFGLYAADSGFKAGTGFESDAVGPFAPESGWTLPTKDNTLTVTEYADDEAYKGNVPAKYADDETNAKYLAVKTTFGDPLTLNVSEATMGDIYFDSLVKFTACDEDPAADSYAGAKLVVYTKEIEGDTVTTKLYVKGGQLTGDGTTATPTVFDCGIWTKGDAWVRLTIKSIANIAKTVTVPGFVVFIDGEAVSTTDAIIAEGATVTLNDVGAYWNDYNSANRLIPSLIQAQDGAYGSDYDQIAGAGFDGQGAIDDLAFTTTVPSFCADPAFFTFTWDENVEGVKYQFGLTSPVELTPDQLAKGTIAIPYIDQQSCTIIVTPKAGFVIDSWTGSPTTEGNAGTFALIAGGIAGGVTTKANEPKMTITINGVAVEGGAVSFADAMAIVNDPDRVTSEDSVKIGLTKDVEVGNSADEFLSDLYLESEGDVVLDLAGHTITGVATGDNFEDAVIDACSPLTIIDSVGGGKITIGADASAGYIGSVTADGADVVIGLADDAADKGATFEGALSVDNDGTISIVRGKFDGDTAPAEEYIADGSACSAEKIDGYWVVAPEAKKWTVIFLVNGQQSGDPVEVNDGASVTEVPEITCDAWQTPQWKLNGEVVKPTEVKITADTTFEGAPFFLEQDADENYLIANEEDFDKFAKAVMGDATLCAASYKLTDNIPLTETWAPIAEFKGTFDGGNFTISNLKFDRAAGNYQGLFGNVTGGTISNLKLVLADWTGTSSGEYGGAALAGKATTSATFNNITVSGSLIGATHNVAGIVCRTYGGTFTFNACTNKAEIGGGYTKVGGLVNMVGVSGTTTFNDCSNEGHIYVTNASKGENGGVGAFVAYYEGTASVVLSGCSSTGLLENQNAASGQGVGAFVNAPNGTGTVSAGAKPNVANVAYWPGNVRVSGHYVGFGAAVVKNGLATWYADYASAMAALGDATSVKVFVTDNVTTPPFNSKSFNLTEIANVADGKVGIGTKVDKDITDSLSTYAVAGTKLEAGEGFWTVVADTPAEDWDHPVVDPTTPGTKAADSWPSLKDTPVAQADASKLVTWAKDKGVTFDKAAEIKVEAFLLDCANTDEAVTAAKAAFKVTSITQDEDGKWVAKVGEAGEGDGYKNGYITIVPYDLEGAGDDAAFFQAQLLLQPVTKE